MRSLGLMSRLAIAGAVAMAGGVPTGRAGSVESDGVLTFRPARYRLNRSRKLEGKPGHYDGKPINGAVRHLPMLRLARLRIA
jgi:hypothetical protein